MMMTPAAPRSRSGSIGNESAIEGERVWDNKEHVSSNNVFDAGDDNEGRGGSFMSSTAVGRRLNAFGGKMRDRTEHATTAGDDSEEINHHKSKLLLGKKILGGIGDR
jgi:hypothetical protein